MIWLWPNGGTASPPYPGKVGKGFRSVSEYGARDPIDTNGDGRPDTGGFHTGIDLVGFTTIRAVADGVVTYVGATSSDGTAVHIAHGDCISSESIHMVAGSARARKGQSVQAGDALGTVGQTGLALGPHLHLRIKINGAITNPRPFLEARVGRGSGSGGANTPTRRKAKDMTGIRFQDANGKIIYDFMVRPLSIRTVSDPAVINKMAERGLESAVYEVPRDVPVPGDVEDWAYRIKYHFCTITGITGDVFDWLVTSTDREWNYPTSTAAAGLSDADRALIVADLVAALPKFPTKVTLPEGTLS